MSELVDRSEQLTRHLTDDLGYELYMEFRRTAKIFLKNCQENPEKLQERCFEFEQQLSSMLGEYTQSPLISEVINTLPDENVKKELIKLREGMYQQVVPPQPFTDSPVYDFSHITKELYASIGAAASTFLCRSIDPITGVQLRECSKGVSCTHMHNILELTPPPGYESRASTVSDRRIFIPGTRSKKSCLVPHNSLFYPTKLLKYSLSTGISELHICYSFYLSGRCAFWGNCPFVHPDVDVTRAACASYYCPKREQCDVICCFVHSAEQVRFPVSLLSDNAKIVNQKLPLSGFKKVSSRGIVEMVNKKFLLNTVGLLPGDGPAMLCTDVWCDEWNSCELVHLLPSYFAQNVSSRLPQHSYCTPDNVALCSQSINTESSVSSSGREIVKVAAASTATRKKFKNRQSCLPIVTAAVVILSTTALSPSVSWKEIISTEDSWPEEISKLFCSKTICEAALKIPFISSLEFDDQKLFSVDDLFPKS